MIDIAIIDKTDDAFILKFCFFGQKYTYSTSKEIAESL